MHKKITFIIIITILLSIFNIVDAEEENCFSYSSLTDFSLYKERVRCLCKKYKPEKPLINIEDKFTEIENKYTLSDIILTHKTNMNNIYKCGILSIQKKSLVLIKEDLINKSPKLLDRIGSKIDEKIFLITSSSSKLGCNDLSNKNSIQKLNVLKQATYETCKYVNYLEYLKEKNKVIKNLIEEDKSTYTLNKLFRTENKYNTNINKEIEHTYKVFPVAFHAYTEYENNIVIHFLLELIKEDYMVLRENLHKTLNPLNQVVYKISNAMRKE